MDTALSPFRCAYRGHKNAITWDECLHARSKEAILHLHYNPPGKRWYVHKKLKENRAHEKLKDP